MALEIPRFQANSNLIMACHITGVYDVNRNTKLDGNDFELVREWAESVAASNLKGLIFHNNFSTETCEKHKNEYLSFIKIKYNPQFNPNVFRYFVYHDFLQQHVNQFNSIFITDISDVILVKNPFTDSFFTENPNAIFCGDEPKVLNNDWMKAHSAHLRSKIQDYAEYENRFCQ